MVSRGMKRVIKILIQNREVVIKKRIKESRAALDQLSGLSPLPKDFNYQKTKKKEFFLKFMIIHIKNVLLVSHF